MQNDMIEFFEEGLKDAKEGKIIASFLYYRNEKLDRSFCGVSKIDFKDYCADIIRIERDFTLFKQHLFDDINLQQEEIKDGA